MQITQEQKAKIEEIISRMECPIDFECYKTGFEQFMAEKIQLTGAGIFWCIKCLGEESKEFCKYSLSFGHRYICRCPLRLYVVKNFHD